MNESLLPARYRWNALRLADDHPAPPKRRERARCAWCGARLFNGSRIAACASHADVERAYLRRIGVLS